MSLYKPLKIVVHGYYPLAINILESIERLVGEDGYVVCTAAETYMIAVDWRTSGHTLAGDIFHIALLDRMLSC